MVAAVGAGRSHPVPSRCSYLIVELMAGSQGSWDRSKSLAWGWEAGMWGMNLPLRVRFPKCNGSCTTPAPSPRLFLTQCSRVSCVPLLSRTPRDLQGSSWVGMRAVRRGMVEGPLLTALFLLLNADLPLPPPPLLGDGDDAEGTLGGAFPPPPPPIEEPFPPAPLEEEIFPSPPPPLEEEGGQAAPVPLPPQVWRLGRGSYSGTPPRKGEEGPSL